MVSSSRRKEFTRLRRQVHQKMEKELKLRYKTNPIPTETELALGVFLERIEPQLREALVILNQKGYCTGNSGFCYPRFEIQDLDGRFRLRHSTIEKLKKMSIRVKIVDWRHPLHLGVVRLTKIYFKTASPDIESIKSQWDALAEELPDLGHPAKFNDSALCWSFMLNWSPNPKLALIARTRRLIAAKHVSRWINYWHKEISLIKKIPDHKLKTFIKQFNIAMHEQVYGTYSTWFAKTWKRKLRRLERQTT